MYYHSYVINLPSARDRWEAIEARLRTAGLSYTRIEGVNGRELRLPIPEFDEFRHRLMTGRRPIPAEIGCYLSHIKAIDAFLASDASCTHALIFEDDANFGEELPVIVGAAIATPAKSSAAVEVIASNGVAQAVGRITAASAMTSPARAARPHATTPARVESPARRAVVSQRMTSPTPAAVTASTTPGAGAVSKAPASRRSPSTAAQTSAMQPASAATAEANAPASVAPVILSEPSVSAGCASDGEASTGGQPTATLAPAASARAAARSVCSQVKPSRPKWPPAAVRR